MRKAFTLVELLVVIAIALILISMIWGAIAKWNGGDGPQETIGPTTPYLEPENAQTPEAAPQVPPGQGAFVLIRGYPVRVKIEGDDGYYVLLAPKGDGPPMIQVEE